MNSKSMRRAWLFGPVLSLSVTLVTCNTGPVPMSNTQTGGGGSGSGSGSGSGEGTGEGTGDGTGTGTGIISVPSGTSTRTSTGTDVTEKQACAVSRNDATMQADILLVLDRSSSMQNAMDTDGRCDTGMGGGGRRRDASAPTTTCTTRWTAVQDTLKQVLDGSAGSMNWGLLMFSTPGQGSCQVGDKVQVEVGSGNADTILGEISKAGTETSTPTRLAMNAGVKYLQTLQGSESKVILLATDGQPNCGGDIEGGGGGGVGGDDVEPTKEAIKAAADAGYKVYILGIGPETNSTVLNDFAAAGGTAIKDVGGAGKDYFAALSADELTKHFESIVSSVASCTFKLSPPKSADLSNVVVEFDGDRNKRATRDTERKNGWDFTTDDHTEIQIYGEWCDGLMNGTYKTAKVLIGCKDQPIP